MILRKDVCWRDFYLPRMVLNLLIGTVVISLTVLVHTFGLIAVTHAMGHLVARFRMHGRRSRIVAMISVTPGSSAPQRVLKQWLNFILNRGRKQPLLQ